MSNTSTQELQEPTVTITVRELHKLQEDVAFLEALRAAGVDNWDGYGDAQDILEEWNNE